MVFKKNKKKEEKKRSRKGKTLDRRMTAINYRGMKEFFKLTILTSPM